MAGFPIVNVASDDQPRLTFVPFSKVTEIPLNMILSHATCHDFLPCTDVVVHFLFVKDMGSYLTGRMADKIQLPKHHACHFFSSSYSQPEFEDLIEDFSYHGVRG